MPSYFFHIISDKRQHDFVGTELADPAAAWDEAVVTTGEIVKDLGGKLKPGDKWQMEVTDENSRLVWTIVLRGE